MVVSRPWRLTTLAVRARLRTVGIAPWLVLLLWGVIAAVGEPSTFRSFTTWLPHQALTAVALVVLGALLWSAPSPRDPWARVATQASLLLTTAVVLGVTLATLEALVAARYDGTALTAAGRFALAAAPLAAAAAIRRPDRPQKASQILASKVVVSISLAMTVPVAVHAATDRLTTPIVVASIACVLGCMVLVACSDASAMMRTDHEDRNTR